MERRQVLIARSPRGGHPVQVTVAHDWASSRLVFALRRHVLAHRHLATLICVAALALKLLIPSGYMISAEHGRIAITICSGFAPQTISPVTSRDMDLTMPEMHGDMADQGKSDEHGRTEMPCAFSSLSAHALAAVDPVLLIAAIAFVMAVGSRAVGSPRLALTPHLRPPSQGPPVFR